MSDFLTHLASRSVNRLPVVQPRLASRFEAIAATPRFYPETAGLMELETEATLSDMEPTVPVQPSQPSPKESGSPPDRITQRGATEARSSEALPTVNRAIQQQFPEAANLISPSNVSPQPSQPFSPSSNPRSQPSQPFSPPSNPRSQPSQPFSPLSNPRSQPLLPFSSLSNPSSQPPQAQSSPQSPVQPLESPVNPVERVTSHETASSTERREEVPQTLQPDEPPIAVTSIRVQPQIMPRLEPSPVSVPVFAPPPPATIHVTIGRIEVRAHTAAAPFNPPSRRPAPALPLDQYLSQRSGGQA